jgi:hypothetical protein
MILLSLNCMSEIRPKHGHGWSLTSGIQKIKYDTNLGSYWGFRTGELQSRVNIEKINQQLSGLKSHKKFVLFLVKTPGLNRGRHRNTIWYCQYLFGRSVPKNRTWTHFSNLSPKMNIFFQIWIPTEQERITMFFLTHSANYSNQV